MSGINVNVEVESISLDLSAEDAVNLMNNPETLDQMVEGIILENPDLIPEQVMAELGAAIEEARDKLKELEERADEKGDECRADDDEEGKDQWRAKEAELKVLMDELKDFDDNFGLALETELRDYQMHFKTDLDETPIFSTRDPYENGAEINIEFKGTTVIDPERQAEIDSWDKKNTNGDVLQNHEDYETWLEESQKRLIESTSSFPLSFDFGDRITGVAYENDTVIFEILTKDGKNLTVNVRGNGLIFLMSPDPNFVTDELLKSLPDAPLKRMVKGEDKYTLYHIFNKPTEEEKRNNAEFYPEVMAGVDDVVATHTSGTNPTEVTAKTKEYLGWLFDAVNTTGTGVPETWARIMTDMEGMEATLKKDIMNAILMSFTLNSNLETLQGMMAPAVTRIENIYFEDGGLDAGEMKYILFMERQVGAGIYGGSELIFSLDTGAAVGAQTQRSLSMGALFGVNVAGAPFLHNTDWDAAMTETALQDYLDLLGQTPFATDDTRARELLDVVSPEGQKSAADGLKFLDLVDELNQEIAYMKSVMTDGKFEENERGFFQDHFMKFLNLIGEIWMFGPIIKIPGENTDFVAGLDPEQKGLIESLRSDAIETWNYTWGLYDD